jgi:hypothetical protein
MLALRIVVALLVFGVANLVLPRLGDPWHGLAVIGLAVALVAWVRQPFILSKTFGPK